MTGLLDDGKVAAVNDVRPRVAGRLDEESKELAQLGRSAREVHNLRLVSSYPFSDATSHVLSHHFAAPGPRIHVAMPAGLVALAPHIDLQRLQPRPAQRQPVCRKP